MNKFDISVSVSINTPEAKTRLTDIFVNWQGWLPGENVEQFLSRVAREYILSSFSNLYSGIAAERADSLAKTEIKDALAKM